MRNANEELQRKIEIDGAESVNLLVVPDGSQHIEMVCEVPCRKCFSTFHSPFTQNLQFGEVPDALDPEAAEDSGGLASSAAARGSAALSAAAAASADSTSQPTRHSSGITVLPQADGHSNGAIETENDATIN
jgi:hypothetical protein